MTLRDGDVARRMLAGDESAFDEFFHEQFPRLYRFALARTNRDPDIAEDVVQAALCAAISKLGTYRGEATLFTWLCTFCRHEISAYYTRLRRAPPTLELVDDHAEVTATLESLSMPIGTGPHDLLERDEVARLVHVTLDHLPTRYAEVLEWKYVDSVSVKDIAARLRLTPKAAESLLTRARAAFRDGFSTLSAAGVCLTLDVRRE